MDRLKVPRISAFAALSLSLSAVSAPAMAQAIVPSATQDLGCDIPTSSFAVVVPGGPQDRGRPIVATPQTPCPNLATDGNASGTNAFGPIGIDVVPPGRRQPASRGLISTP